MTGHSMVTTAGARRGIIWPMVRLARAVAIARLAGMLAGLIAGGVGVRVSAVTR